MDRVIRQSGESSVCPRCGRPVIYKGRGRRPVWCSSTCRVEASIERKGNRVVGVQPDIVTIERRTTRSRQDRKDRESVEREVSDRVALARVAASPALLEQLVGELRHARASRPDKPWDVVTRLLVRAAEELQPPGVAEGLGGGRKRPAGEWADLLSELAVLLRSGQFYDRDLPEIDEAMDELAAAYLRRRTPRR